MRPNILVFFTDQQRWDTTGLHGNPLGLTRNFDAMAGRGTFVANSFTCQPVCGPARSCLQTGLYATQTGCWRNGIPLPKDKKTLAQHFGGAGYRTGYIGKWHLAERGDPVVPEDRGGYDYWLAANVLELSSDAYDTRLWDKDGNLVRLPGYRVDAQTDAAIRWMTEPAEDPFYLFLSFLEPHHQNHVDDYPPPDFYRESYDGRWVPPDLAALGGSAHKHLGGYYGMVKRLDEALGRIRDALKSTGQLENTVILFTSDHGCHFKTRNGEYKRSCHESSIHVPTFLSGPGFEGGGRRPELVSLVDLPPTLLDAAGLEVPPEMSGRSLLRRMRGEDTDWPESVFVQISEAETGRAVRTQRWKYAVTDPAHSGFDHGPAAQSYREAFLYDLENDPHELRNLIGNGRYVNIAEEMRALLLGHIERVEGVVPRIDLAQWTDREPNHWDAPPTADVRNYPFNP